MLGFESGRLALEPMILIGISYWSSAFKIKREKYMQLRIIYLAKLSLSDKVDNFWICIFSKIKPLITLKDNYCTISLI